ncbi:hypothetical protein C5167_002609 [Papaver somniferum]|uniref:Uncharacterized protein n=1 Tax=Papaver somniferum TaxID=3469 RepID=A0A4Y7KYM4_PAPSO|nr:hypothetical protein C5167_002609 [Papaver somniferum]
MRCELEPEFVTELPKEIFKRPKLKNHSLGLRRSGAVKSSNPVPSSEKTSIPISKKGTNVLNAAVNRIERVIKFKRIFEAFAGAFGVDFVVYSILPGNFIRSHRLYRIELMFFHLS